MECTGDFEVNVTGKMPRFAEYGERQLRNAAVIIKVGQEMKVAPRGWVIAVATAMQESRLLNLANSTVGESRDIPNEGVGADHDSVGLFQQRASWGTVAQRMDPAYASRKFYEKLVDLPDWEKLPLTVAAQRVQISAFPDAYAKHEELAARIVDALAGGAARTALIAGQQVCDAAAGGEIAASGWTAPIPGGVGSGFRTASRPGHNGVDISAIRGTDIRVAATAGYWSPAATRPERTAQLRRGRLAWQGRLRLVRRRAARPRHHHPLLSSGESSPGRRRRHGAGR